MNRPSWSRGDLLHGVTVALVLVLGLLPFRVLLPLWPMTMDGTLWVSRSSIRSGDWLSWDLLQSHFIGYRPVTALSFTVDSILGWAWEAVLGGRDLGYVMEIYRGTDLLLHAAAALGVYALLRGLLGPAGRWAGLVAMAAFLLHPGMEEVLPFFSRRSYVLSTALGTAAVALFATRLRRHGAEAGWRVQAPAGVLLLLSMLANEEGYVLLPVLLLLVLATIGRGVAAWRGVPGLLWRGGGLLVVVGLLALTLKLGVTSELGGYGKELPDGEKLHRLLSTAAAHVLLPPAANKAPNALALGGWGFAVPLAWLVGVGIVLPAVRVRRARAARDWAFQAVIPGVLLAWLLGYVLLSVVTGAWFSRQVYPTLVPVAALVGWTTHEGISGLRSRRWGWGLALVPVLWGLVASAILSPVGRMGISDVRWQTLAAQQDRIDTLRADLDALPRGPAVVWLVTPAGITAGWDVANTEQLWYHGQRTSSWVKTLLNRPKLMIKDLGWVRPPGSRLDRLSARVDWIERRPGLVFPVESRLFFKKTDANRPREGVNPAGEPVIWLDTVPPTPRLKAGAPRWLYWFEGAKGRIVPMPGGRRPGEGAPVDPAETGGRQ